MGPEHQVQPRPVRILLAEDDPLLQELFGSALALQGYDVETASDGLDALWKVRKGRYDLVLCDYKLPELSGLAMARLTRDLVNTAIRPALIALTGTPASLAGNGALPGCAFDEVVAKPVSLDELVLVVRRHLDARSEAAAPRDAGPGMAEGQADYDADPAASSRDGQPSPPCILVVEDDEVQRSAMTCVLEASGFAVKAAVDGFHAVRMLRDGAFDLVLVDYHLPGMDGLATGRLIRNLVDEDVRPRMIAFTSAPVHLASRLAGADSAFDEIVAKSAGLPALLATVERHLRLSPRAAARLAAAAVLPPAA